MAMLLPLTWEMGGNPSRTGEMCLYGDFDQAVLGLDVEEEAEIYLGPGQTGLKDAECGRSELVIVALRSRWQQAQTDYAVSCGLVLDGDSCSLCKPLSRASRFPDIYWDEPADQWLRMAMVG